MFNILKMMHFNLVYYFFNFERVLQQICVSYFACIPFICFYNMFFFNATYSRLLIIVSVEGDFDWIIVRFVAMCVSSLTTTSFRNLSVSLAFRID